jgi:3-dehydroquinate dehydratase
MATKEQIIKAILDVAGNPAAGDLRDLSEAMADAIIAIDVPVKEVRVIKTEETR